MAHGYPITSCKNAKGCWWREEQAKGLLWIRLLSDVCSVTLGDNFVAGCELRGMFMVQFQVPNLFLLRAVSAWRPGCAIKEAVVCVVSTTD